MADTQGEKSMATIGRSIVFKGELTGDEDLEIDGQVEGTVNLKNHQLTIGANGNLKAEVTAKSIIVIGQVKGNLTAAEGIEVQATGIVEGDVSAPRLNVQEGAVLNGSIDMSASIVSDTKKPVSQSSASAPPSISTSTTAPA
jgi:cytoskeletal protein CcmA (bactofilin family)